MTQSPSSFGALLRRLRTAADLTQEALAEQAGLSKRGLQDLERGINQRPRQSTVALLVAALALSPSDQAALVAAARPLPRARHAPTAMPALFTADASTPLIGRAGELALLDHFLDGASAASVAVPVLLLAGEPGIGKSRLLRAAAERAGPAGWRVLAGGCVQRGGQDPYAPLLDALLGHIQALRPEGRRAALAGCGWLARVLPALAPVLEPLPSLLLSPEQEHRLIAAAVARFLANVAGLAGTLLILDDLQWAGPDALALINALAHQSLAPLRILGAYRDTEAPPAEPLGVLVADLAQAHLVRHHALGPLAQMEAEALLAALLGTAHPALPASVPARAAGVPFFLVSFAHALQMDGAEAVPWDLAQSVRRRVVLLPEAGQEVLVAAAVVGRRSLGTVLLAVVARPEEVVLAGLEAACRARLLLEDEDSAYTFAHDIIREVVLADLSALRRAVLHRKVAETMAAAPSPSLEALAYHYARGTAPEQAIPYLEQAGDHAMAQRAHGAAESHYQEALDLLDRHDQPREAARLRGKLGRVLKETGRYPAAQGLLEAAAAVYHGAGDWENLGRIMYDIGELYVLRGAAEEGIARLRPLLELLMRDEASPMHASLHLSLGILLYNSGRYAEGLLANERALDLARAQGDDRLVVKSAWLRADALQVLGHLEEALEAGRAILPLAEMIGDLECLLAISRDMAYIHALRGDFLAARPCSDRALALAEQLENPSQQALSQAVRGWLAALQGDVVRAHADLDQALALRHQLGRSWHSAYLLIFVSSVSLIEGAWEAARAAGREAIALAEESGDPQALRWAAGIMAEVDILEGRPEDARARLVPLLDRPGMAECEVTRFLPMLAWAHLDLGEIDQATRVVEQALARARPERMLLVLVEALRVRTMVAMAQGHLEAAARSLEEGLDLARRMPYPHAEARLLQLKRVLDAKIGEPDAAGARLR